MGGEGSPLLKPPAATLPRDVPLHPIRFLGAVHIVFFHCWPSAAVAEWGPVWVWFFFLLSGFGPAYSRLLRDGAAQGERGTLLPQPRTLLRRLISVYPTYVFALVGCLALKLLGQPVTTPPSPRGVLAESSLLQSWTFPNASELAEVANYPDWYVSALAGYWLLENLLFELGGALERGCRCDGCAAGLGAFGAWLAGIGVWIAAWPFVECGLYVGVSTSGQGFVHMYALGVGLAFLVHARAAANSPQLPYLATAALTLKLLLILFVPTGPDGPNLNLEDYPCALHSGFLLPLDCAVVLGLAEAGGAPGDEAAAGASAEASAPPAAAAAAAATVAAPAAASRSAAREPLAGLLRWQPLGVLRALAYPVYILQVLIPTAFKVACGKEMLEPLYGAYCVPASKAVLASPLYWAAADALFLLGLVGLSLAVHHGVQKPAARALTACVLRPAAEKAAAGAKV